MELSKLSLDSKPLVEAWKIYQESIPKNEQRPTEKQSQAMRLPNYSFYAISKDGEVVALLAAWEFENFVFIEHLAVKESMRGLGIGSKILKGFIESAKKTLLLETYPLSNKAGKRRMKFYQHAGFRLNPYEYIQPAYSEGQKPLRMSIMSQPGILAPKEFEQIRREIHLKVYGCENPVTEI